MITTVRIKETTVNGQPATAVSVSGNHGHFVDSFSDIDQAILWAIDILIAYFSHTYAEAMNTVMVGIASDRPSLAINVAEDIRVNEAFAAYLSKSKQA